MVLFFICKQRRFPLYPAELFRPGLFTLRLFLRYSLLILFNEFMWALGQSVFTSILGHASASADLLAAFAVISSIDKLAMVWVGRRRRHPLGTLVGTRSRKGEYLPTWLPPASERRPFGRASWRCFGDSSSCIAPSGPVSPFPSQRLRCLSRTLDVSFLSASASLPLF